ncbi:hypothetical protein C8F04DRAFT_1252632 [Mycena alexandri]|uniref:Uncharacterized protein n=1 Tax=Mycena alexandri TaxID=1745969 RepID=A0AAD6XAW9_9AGAR|nr:hypothetical protein C8F04DRAFT_1252632 [Mycena alexandri]
MVSDPPLPTYNRKSSGADVTSSPSSLPIADIVQSTSSLLDIVRRQGCRWVGARRAVERSHAAAIVLAALKERCYFARSPQEMSFRNTLHGSSHLSQSTHHLCPWCGMCPICGSIAPTPPAAMVVHAPPALAPVDERIVQFLFTLFVLETHLSGDWRHLILPYAMCILIFFPCLIKALLAFFH